MKIVVAVLCVLLFATNGFWLFYAIDVGVSASYKEQRIYELEETRKQLMAIMPEVAKNMTKNEIISAAGRHASDEIFEKDGCTWVGWLGLKFDKSNHLVSVSPSWSYEEAGPCF